MGGHLTQPLKRAALINPNGIATIDGDRQYCWSEVLDRVSRLAGGLRSLDIGSDDKVAVLAFGSDRYFELHFALPWIGATIVPLNTRLSPGEIEYMIINSGANVLFIDEENRSVLEAMPKVEAGLKTIISMSDRSDGSWVSYEQLINDHEPAPDTSSGGSQMAGIFYTGGSSGRSKGVMLSHDNLLSNAINTVIGVGYKSSSIYLHAAPMFHLTDGMSTYSVTTVGGTHVFIPKFDAREVLELIARHKVTNVCLVPTMIEMMVGLAEKETFDVSSLVQFQFGSSPMPEATLARAIKLWPDMLYLHGWGMTEISPIGLMLPWEFRDPKIAGNKLRSCGVPALNEEARIVDPDGNDLAAGEVGELIIRGPMVMQGYWDLPEETAKALRDGWLYTGDAAYRDEDGLFYIADRLKDMIISGGENIYSVEVENVIGQYPGVAQVAIIGRPHPKWGESVHAVIVPESGVEIDADAIRDFVKSKIASYKAPRSVSIRTEPMPLTGAGKVFKRLLREEDQEQNS